MIRRSLCALALVSALSTSAGAKPPDLPMNETITVAPKGEPPAYYVPAVDEPIAGGCGVILQKELPGEYAPSLSGGAIVTVPALLSDGFNYQEMLGLADPLIQPPSPRYQMVVTGWSRATIKLTSGLRAHPLFQAPRQAIGLWSSDERGVDNSTEQQTSIVKCVAEEELPPTPSVYDILPESLPTPAVYQLRPTARNTLVGSLLLGVNPLLALLPTDKALDAPHDHPRKVAGDDVLSDFPVPHYSVAPYRGMGTYYVEDRDMLPWLISHWATRHEKMTGDYILADLPTSCHQEEVEHGFQGEFRSASVRAYIQCQVFEKWMSHWAARHATPSPEENEGYIHVIMPTAVASLTPVDTPVEEIDVPLVPAVEALPMPKEDTPADGVTCPYLRQQALDRHACPIADPEIGRDVLDNLERLTKADKLVELANELARAGRIIEAMHCCLAAADLCPGSPSAARAADMLIELCFGSHEPANDTEESAETSNTPPGVEQQVNGLMKACRLLMNEGQHEQAAELARQAYALDPERVMADPLIYKMHLLADTPAKHPAGASEESEPPSCPYCPVGGKPIREIVPDKKKSESGPTTFLVPPLPKVDYEVVPALERVQAEKAAGAEEASEEQERSSLDPWIEAALGGPGKLLLGFGFGRDGGLRLCGECSCAGSVYHVLYSQGTLALWKTPDAAKIKP